MGWMQRGWGGGEVDALGQGALDGGIMGGSRVPVEQARLLNQVHAVGVCAAGEKKIFFFGTNDLEHAISTHQPSSHLGQM